MDEPADPRIYAETADRAQVAALDGFTITDLHEPTDVRAAMEQAGPWVPEPPPLPAPWPGMVVEARGDDGWIRAVVTSADVDRCYVNIGTAYVAWNRTTIREVRTPDGVTVWKRAKDATTPGE